VKRNGTVHHNVHFKNGSSLGTESLNIRLSAYAPRDIDWSGFSNFGLVRPLMRFKSCAS